MLPAHCLGQWGSPSDNKPNLSHFTSNTLCFLLPDSLKQPGSGQPTPRLRGSRGVPAAFQGSTVGTRHAQQAGPPLLRARPDPLWEAARLRFLQAFPDRIPLKNQPVSKFLGKRLQLCAGSAGPDARWPNGKGRPGCQSAQSPRPEPQLSSIPAGIMPFPEGFPPALSKRKSNNPRAGTEKAAGAAFPACPRTGTVVPTLTLRCRVRAGPTAPRPARLLPHPDPAANRSSPRVSPPGPRGCPAQAADGGAGRRLRGLCCHLQGTAGLVPGPLR